MAPGKVGYQIFRLSFPSLAYYFSILSLILSFNLRMSLYFNQRQPSNVRSLRRQVDSAILGVSVSYKPFSGSVHWRPPLLSVSGACSEFPLSRARLNESCIRSTPCESGARLDNPSALLQRPAEWRVSPLTRLLLVVSAGTRLRSVSAREPVSQFLVSLSYVSRK